MSNTISPTTTTSTLAGALLNLGSNQNNAAASSSSSANAGVNLDSLQLSNSSIDELEQQAQDVAAQNQNSVIGTSDEALAVNLQAVAALGQNFGQATAGQGGLDAASVLSVTQ